MGLSTKPSYSGVFTIASLGLISQSSNPTYSTSAPSMIETSKKVSDFIERKSQIEKLNVEIKRQYKNPLSFNDRDWHWKGSRSHR